MLEVMTRYWWATVLRGVAAVLFGVMAVIWPDVTLLALLVLFGAYVLVDGVFALASAIAGGRVGFSRAWLTVEGIAGVAAGIITFSWPRLTAMALVWVIAIWALVTGVFRVATAIRLRREIRGEWLLALDGALTVLFGIALAVWPNAGALTLVLLIGLYAIVSGAVLIGLGLHLRTLHTPPARPAGFGTHRPAPA